MIIIEVIGIITRQCLLDDYFGVGESLEEKAFGEGLVARGSHLLVRWGEKSFGQVRRKVEKREKQTKKSSINFRFFCDLGTLHHMVIVAFFVAQVEYGRCELP